ncbi:MAG: hypothetical protein WC096_05870, partial [Sphaerochaetaceae bacterium]
VICPFPKSGVRRTHNNKTSQTRRRGMFPTLLFSDALEQMQNWNFYNSISLNMLQKKCKLRNPGF